MCVCCVLVAQSHPAVCDPMDYSPPGSSVHGILQAEYWRQNTPGRMDCHSFLQRIFLTQESNPGRLHCRQILYHLSHHYLGMLRSTDQEIAIERTVYYTHRSQKREYKSGHWNPYRQLPKSSLREQKEGIVGKNLYFVSTGRNRE